MNLPKLIFLSVIVASSVFARVGETEAQLLKRFGEPNSRGQHTASAQGRSFVLGPTLTFKQDDWRIECDIVDGRCARIHYSKIGEWSEAHFQSVLNANSQGATWSDTSNPTVKKMAREWKRSDGGVAKWMLGDMQITVPAYGRAIAVAEAKAKAAARAPAKI